MMGLCVIGGFITPYTVLSLRSRGSVMTMETPKTCKWWKVGAAYSGEPDAGFCHNTLADTNGYVCDRRMHALSILPCCDLTDKDDKNPYYHPI